MRRYPPHDPPEFVDWAPDADVLDEYRRRCAHPAVQASLEVLGRDGLERIYRALVRSRLHDITLKRWVRTGTLTKAWLGTGEEALTIGAVHALAADDVVAPMIRNQYAAFEKGIPLAHCFGAYLGSGETVTGGCDLHIGDLEHSVIAPISHVGDLVPVAAGFALAFATRDEPRVALTWTGEGATATGAVHEGLQVAARLRVPLIVVVQDNRVALGTPVGERQDAGLRALAASHGIPGLECDGNHVLEVHATVREARRRCLAGEGPVLILGHTFRMGGHATHDEAEARALFPAEVFDHWGRRDPVACFEHYLTSEDSPLGGEAAELLGAWEAEVTDEVEAAAADALAGVDRRPPRVESLRGAIEAPRP